MAVKKPTVKGNEDELLIKKLIQLTAEDKIVWENKNPLVANNHSTTYKDINFYTEWLQDGKPKLMWIFEELADSSMSTDMWDGSLKHDLVGNLIEEIKKQQQRQDDKKKINTEDFEKGKIKRVLKSLNS